MSKKHIPIVALLSIGHGLSGAAHALTIKNEIKLDYIDYFEDIPGKVNSRELVQYRPSATHSFTDTIEGYVQLEFIRDFSDKKYNDERIRELYLLKLFDNADLRVGKHQVVWGRTDFFNPTDTITPVDYSDYYDTEDQRQPVNLANLRYYFEDSDIQVFAQSSFEATRMPYADSRWMLPATLFIDEGHDIATVTESDEPDETFTAYGIKQTFFLDNFDFSLSFLRGWHSLPNLEILSTDESQLLSYYYYKRDQWGADFSSAFGKVGLRGELAYVSVIEDSYGNERNGGYVQYALGLDRTFTGAFWGHDFYANVELLGDENVETDTFARVALFDTFDVAVGTQLQVSIGYTWEYTLEILSNLEKKDYRIRPKVMYSPFDGTEIDFIIDLGDGRPDTFYGLFRDNDRFQVRLTYAF